jgi:thiamine pyrophosphate-dependent acetolactate synthase large subunit-like protein
VAATGTPGTTIHTTGVSATIIDEIWLYATNNDTVPRNLTVEYGNGNIELAIPAKSGLSLVVTGLVLRGDGSAGITVAAFASAANQIRILGYVNRITP